MFFHKRRSYFTSICCGTVTCVLYLMIIFYASVRFVSVFTLQEYNVVEEFKPLELSPSLLTFDTFLDTSELVIQFVRPWSTINDSCTNLYSKNVSLVSINPNSNLTFTMVDDYTFLEPRCNITIDS